MWAASVLGNKVICYLDDDVSRKGEFNGRRVITPPFECDIPVVAPFPDWQLDDIKSYNPNLRFV